MYTITAFLSALTLVAMPTAQVAFPAEEESAVYAEQQSVRTSEKNSLITTGEDSLVSDNSPVIFKNIGYVKITAYSSTPDQTDDSPFIMASGKHVYDGAVAANFLSLGTKVKMPDLYGNKVFTVEDRMHSRFSDRMDIWMATRSEASRFGLKHARIEVVMK